MQAQAREEESPGPPSTAATPRARHRLRSLFGVFLFSAALIHPLARVIARWDFHADLLTHFQLPALLTTIVAFVVLVRRHRRQAAILAILALCQAVPLFRYSGSNPIAPDIDSPPRLRILMANVYAKNRNFTALVQLIEREQPDIVGIVEYSRHWQYALIRTQIRERYPYRIEHPHGPQGLALWSRIPFVDAPPVEVLTPGGSPAAHVTIRYGGRPVRLWLVHPPNPLFEGAISNVDLLALGTRIGYERGSQLVVGDLNRTEGSPFFDDFRRLTGLRDSRYGFGAQPSWPSWCPYRIAIDHAFLSPDLAVANRRLGPPIGSDHLPLILDIASSSEEARKSVTHPSHASR